MDQKVSECQTIYFSDEAPHLVFAKVIRDLKNSLWIKWSLGWHCLFWFPEEKKVSVPASKWDKSPKSPSLPYQTMLFNPTYQFLLHSNALLPTCPLHSLWSPSIEIFFRPENNNMPASMTETQDDLSIGYSQSCFMRPYDKSM